VRLGLVPELASSFLLPRLIGMQKTKELMFFGEDISAEEALALGLVNKVVSHDELMSSVVEAAGKLIPPNGPAMAVRLTKRLLNRQLLQQIQRALDDENTALNQAMKSEDFVEAVTARIEKRNPVYRGR
jgi:enoyl-CoA hydratase/carnithine racemase